MENVVHKIYHLTFPCGEDYVGSTSQKLNERYGRYRNDAKKSKSPICQISTQHRFEEVDMVEVDIIECPKHDPRITMLEEVWKKKLKPTLNIRQAHRTKEENKEGIREWCRNNRILINERQKQYDKTPIGLLNSTINDARSMIKHYTKQNRPDMVKKWEGILEERIQNRLAHQSK